MSNQEYHQCSICNQGEFCKGEKCDFMKYFGFHASCYAEQNLSKRQQVKSVDRSES